jgi:hypothetical protein
VSNPQLYALLYVTVDGALLTEESSVQVRRASNAQIVQTTAKGFAGVSPGAPMVNISIKNALPAADIEYDAGDVITSLAVVEIGVIHPSGKQLVAKGFILEDTFGHSVGSESNYDFEFVGSMPGFEE